MKGIYFLDLFLVLGCSRTAKNITSYKTTTNIDWLVGYWVRTKGKNTFESWTKTDEGYDGSAVTLVKSDTVFRETLRAYNVDHRWY